MKEFLTFLGIVASLGLGIWNLWHTRRTQYINTVTSERVKWIQELRKNVSALSGAVHTWALTYANASLPQQREGETALLADIDRLRYLIRLQLNPTDSPDDEIEALLLRIPTLTNSATQEQLLITLEALTQKTQMLLKKEWQKVKKEANPKIISDEYC